MTMRELDDSHRCLLENLQTFSKMTTAYKDIVRYIKDVLQDLARSLNQQQSSMKFDEKTIPQGWLDASDLPNAKGTDHALRAVGLEGLEGGPDAIVGSSVVDHCRAYV
jgi:hypothetical protein